GSAADAAAERRHVAAQQAVELGDARRPALLLPDGADEGGDDAEHGRRPARRAAVLLGVRLPRVAVRLEQRPEARRGDVAPPTAAGDTAAVVRHVAAAQTRAVGAA